MYERFTDRARKVMNLANTEAQRLNHEYIGTEHMLIGILREGEGVACRVLRNRGISSQQLFTELGKVITPGQQMVTVGKLPQTPRVKKVIEYVMEEARDLNDQHVGTEHLLLGLLRAEEGTAAIALKICGIDLDAARNEVRLFRGSRPSVAQEQPTIPKLNWPAVWPTADQVAVAATTAAANYMLAAAQNIDLRFGEGYAKQNPQLVAAFMQVACGDFAGSSAVLQAEKYHHELARLANQVEKVVAGLVPLLDRAVSLIDKAHKDE